ncbi:Tol biopolymer transport system component [Saonia flava]|uniref:Tol biopolymer transport system component n=1 Tax=Saonia flava TaxID=523696 RepID=A0A846R0K6_9FLAO|nr:SMP-30/gluconolactonase/LRE family protein [Saonia flava]NJB72690.1 Tol biopolymer transport system component [Saonia flava]
MALTAKNSSILIFTILLTITMTQAQKVGIFENHHDIGNVKHEGSAIYNEDTQEYTITGSGTNMWFGEDEFHYMWKSIQGDFILRAQMSFVGEGVDPHRKIGWTVRDNFHSNGKHVNATIHGDGLTSLQYRRTIGGETEQVESPAAGSDVVQLERRGNTYIMSTAKFGEPFTSVQVEMDLRNEVFVGISMCSHNPDVVEKAIVKNVRIIKPTPEDYQPYRDYIGSHLEVMNVETGDRKILMSSAHSIQAPNWTPDGKTLIYNSNGVLYKYDLESGKVSMLNTGFANRNNNDHILNADGTKIAISHHNDDDGGTSSIYYLPIEGSDNPTKVTKDGVGASYLHGWSPNGKKMIFTANRNDQYDIYEVDVSTGEEKQLTNESTLDDGSEYSPDGKFIYFNSNRTGAMQIWRMKANGKDQTQMTFNKKHYDWFPHISPNEKRIFIISFPDTIESDQHPFYQHCLLRIMPIKGGEPKIIGYIYGGQGTINVPSWSPDSKYVAFVTNTGTVN